MKRLIPRLTVLLAMILLIFSRQTAAEGGKDRLDAESNPGNVFPAKSAVGAAQASDGVPVEFQQYDSYFEKNNSGLKGEKSYLVLTSQKEFDKVFGPATTMGKNSFLPPDVFQTKIVIATIKRGDLRQYEEVRVAAKDGTLAVSYNAKDYPPGSATFSSPLILSVDKGKYEQVVFIESGKEAGRVKTGQDPDIFGYFFFRGAAPRGFTDIDVLNLGGTGEYGAGAKPPFYGLIRLKNKAKTDYKLLKPAFDGNNFRFKTRAVGGVSYEFEGAFTRLDFAEKQLQDVVVLSGTLKKMSAGKMITQAKVDFTWVLGG